MAYGFKALCTMTLLFCVFLQTFSEAKEIPFPESVIKELAKRNTRLHHYTWHVVREFWTVMTPEQQKELEDLGWGTSRPSLRYDEKGNPIAIMDNNAGEDFLYMHRKMIEEVNKLLKKYKEPYGRVKGWKKIPAPGDRDWPITLPYDINDDKPFHEYIWDIKSDGFYWNALKPMEDLFTNPEELKKMTLGEMGSRIENTIHIWMHMRWSDPSALGYRGRINVDNALLPIESYWDDAKYDWLGDSYSSHCHPIFWKLHGWVDDRIEDWRKAHGLRTIPWKGTWTGGPMPMSEESCGNNMPGGLRGASQPVAEDTLEKVCQVLHKAGFGMNRFDTNVILDERP